MNHFIIFLSLFSEQRKVCVSGTESLVKMKEVSNKQVNWCK